MLSSWRNRRCKVGRHGKTTTTTTTTSSSAAADDTSTALGMSSSAAETTTTTTLTTELTIPSHFLCPISLDLMRDPVTLSTGITYDRESIEAWMTAEQGHNTCPVTNQPLTSLDPIPNHVIRRMIQDWCVENRSHGVERISTPRVPLGPSEASDLLAKISSSTAGSTSSSSNGDVRAWVAKVTERVRESERNRRVIVSRGGARALAASFESLAAPVIGIGIGIDQVGEKNDVVLEEILECIALMGRLDAEAQLHLGSQTSLKRIVSTLGRGDLSVRRNAILVLKQINAESQLSSLAAAEGAVEALFKLVKEPICPVSLKASLVVLYRTISSSSSSTMSKQLVDLDAASELLEIAIGCSDKSVCEKALGVLDKLCDSDEGKESLRANALAVPVVVKKMLRVSDLATEFAVSTLLKLAVADEEGSGPRWGVLEEAIGVGAFQKLLLLLQVGSNDGERAKKGNVTKLLRMMNAASRRSLNSSRFECAGSFDLKGIKRSF